MDLWENMEQTLKFIDAFEVFNIVIDMAFDSYMGTFEKNNYRCMKVKKMERVIF